MDLRKPYGARRAELARIARERGLENADTMTRDELLAALNVEAKVYDAKEGTAKDE